MLYHSQQAFYGRDLLPIPQEMNFLVERLWGPFLTMVQDVCLTGAVGFKQVDGEHKL